jgi:hypothetical protein
MEISTFPEKVSKIVAWRLVAASWLSTEIVMVNIATITSAPISRLQMLSIIRFSEWSNRLLYKIHRSKEIRANCACDRGRSLMVAGLPPGQYTNKRRP